MRDVKMSVDPLEMYSAEIANAEAADLPSYMDDKTTVGEAKSMAVRDLAAEVRAQHSENERLLADWAADLDRLEARVAKLETELAAMTEKYDDAMANLNDPKDMVWT